MPKLDTTDCPKCGAPVQMHGLKEVRCEYCGTLAHVQEKATKAPAGALPATGGSMALVLVGLGAAVVAAGAGVAVLALRAHGGDTGLGDDMSFEDPPMLADVNGDGVPDVVSHI